MVYVCDEVRDLEACEKLNIKAIAVSWGFEEKTLLEQANPYALVHSPDALYEILKAEMAGAEKAIFN